MASENPNPYGVVSPELAEEIETFAAVAGATDVVRINRWLEHLVEAKKTRDRVHEVYRHRIKGLDLTITYWEDRLRAVALLWRGDTGERSIPLTAGTISIRDAAARVEAAESDLIEAAELLGLDADPAFYTPPPPTPMLGTWDLKAVLKRLSFPEKRPRSGEACAFDPTTGTQFPKIRKVWAKDGEWTVSIKPGKIEPLESEEADAAA